MRCPQPEYSFYFVVNDILRKMLPKAHLPEGVYAGGLKLCRSNIRKWQPAIMVKRQKSNYDGIIALNTMLAQDGFRVYVPEGAGVERPIQLINIFRSDVEMLWRTRRILVIMEPRSKPSCSCAIIASTTM